MRADADADADDDDDDDDEEDGDEFRADEPAWASEALLRPWGCGCGRRGPYARCVPAAAPALVEPAAAAEAAEEEEAEVGAMIEDWFIVLRMACKAQEDWCSRVVIAAMKNNSNQSSFGGSQGVVGDERGSERRRAMLSTLGVVESGSEADFSGGNERQDKVL